MIRWEYQYVRLFPVTAALASLLVASGAGARWGVMSSRKTRVREVNPAIAQPVRLLCGCPPRLFAYVVTMIVAAVPIVAGAAVGVFTSALDTATLPGIAIFLALAILAELKPVPLDEEGAGSSRSRSSSLSPAR